MLKYLNSPLKLTGTLLILAGALIATLSIGQFLFLGLSVISLGILIHVTNGILLKSEMKYAMKKVFEIGLILFISVFCSLLLLDYLGVISLNLWWEMCSLLCYSYCVSLEEINKATTFIVAFLCGYGFGILVATANELFPFLL